MNRSKTTRKTKAERTTERRSSTLNLRLVLPGKINKDILEFHIADILVVTEDLDAGERVATVETIATVIALPPQLASHILERIVELGAKIDSGQLEQLTNMAALRGELKSVSDSEMEFYDRIGHGYGGAFHDTSGFTSSNGRSVFDPPETIGEKLVRAGTYTIRAGAMVAGLGVVTGVPQVTAVGVITAGLGSVIWAIGDALPGGPDKEYPDVPELDPETSARLLLALSARLGNSLFSNVERSIDAHTGGHLGVPERERSGLFGNHMLDAPLLALMRAAIEKGTGGHVTDPSPASPDRGQATYIDPALLAVDPTWNPYFVNAALASASDRHALVNQMADQIKVKSVSVG